MLPDTSYHNHFSSPTDNHYLDFLVVTSLLDLGWEDPLKKGKTTHSSILAWRIPWTIQPMGSQRVGHD